MASVSIDDARYAVTKAYPGLKRKRKVRNMSDNQVIALYYKFLGSGKIDTHPKKHSTTNNIEKKQRERVSVYVDEDHPFEAYVGEQLSLDL